MFTQALQDALDNAGYGGSKLEGNTLSHDNKEEGSEEDATVKLEVTEEDEDTIIVKITHADGEWKNTFHTCDASHDELAQVITDEYDYWSNN